MIAEIIRRELPEMVSIEESFGGGGWRSGANTGNFTLKLKSKSQRSRSSEQIASDLRRSLANIPGVIIRTRASGGQMMFGMRGGGGQERVQVEIRGYNLEIAEALAQQAKKIIENVKGITDIRISREAGNPEELFVIDRQAAADLKLSVTQIGRTIQTMLMGSQASLYREAGREFRILVKVKDSEQMDTDNILDLTLTNADGEQVSLRNVVNTRPRRGPIRIERRDRERVVTISGEIAGRDLASILSDVRKGLRSIPLPRNFTIAFTGDYEERQKAFRELLLSIILALLLVYMIMAMLYESVRDPFIVMFSVPLAAIGVVLMLFLTKTTFNVQTYIGCIMLGGIVVNNAIILVDYTNLLRRRDNYELREAIEEAGRRRLRPILMTAFTAVMATLPLALGLNEGGEAQAPLARAVIGGLTSSTLITLVVVPVIYSLFEGRRKKRKQEA
jgi:HAE1 family hydrophobic/amphiphilic exporter-1